MHEIIPNRLAVNARSHGRNTSPGSHRQLPEGLRRNGSVLGLE